MLHHKIHKTHFFKYISSFPAPPPYLINKLLFSHPEKGNFTYSQADEKKLFFGHNFLDADRGAIR
jgi:hypothetical protein